MKLRVSMLGLNSNGNLFTYNKNCCSANKYSDNHFMYSINSRMVFLIQMLIEGFSLPSELLLMFQLMDRSRAFDAVTASFSSDYVLFSSLAMTATTRVTSWKRVRWLSQLEKKTISEGEFVPRWKFCASPQCSTDTMDFNFQPYTGMFWHMTWSIQAHTTICAIFP